MAELTTLASLLLNITDNSLNISDSDLNGTDNGLNSTGTAAHPPSSVYIPRYPPGYFIISSEDMSKIRLAFYAVIIPLTAIIGLVGNVISFVVLLRHRMPQTTKMVLLSITVYDFINLITVLMYCLIGISNALSYKLGQNLGRRAHAIFGSYLMMVFGRVSSVLIVVMSLERLCAVYFPLKVKTIWSPKVMGICIFVCSLYCGLFFIPMALEYTSMDIPIPNSSDVTTILVLTEIGKDRNAFATFHSTNMIMTRIVPVFVVMVCNIAISINLYRSRSTRSKMTSQVSGESSAEQRITKLLFSLSVLYFICIMPHSILIIVQLFDVDRPYPFNRNNIYTLMIILFFWSEVVNSSANFIIYIASSKQMRTEFKRVASCGWYDSVQKRKMITSEGYDLGSSSVATSAVSVSGL